MWRCFSSAGNRRRSHSYYTLAVCLTPRLWKWSCRTSIFPLCSLHTCIVCIVLFHSKTLVESCILLRQGRIPSYTIKGPFQSFQFRSYLLTASGKCSIHLSQQKVFPAEWEDSKAREKRTVCVHPCHWNSGPRRNTGLTFFFFFLICQLSLMVHFFLWLVISDCRFILVEVVFLGRPSSLGYERVCLWMLLDLLSNDTTEFSVNFSAYDSCTIRRCECPP